MTEYQIAVAEHMKDAPEELREYVCGRLINDSWWSEGKDPIDRCGFNWDESEEGRDFWVAIDNKQCQKAMATDFWKEYTKKKLTEEPKDYSALIASEYDRLKEKQLAKNKDYGDSLFKDKTILGVEINKRIGILSRIGDKIARLESQGQYMVEEGREETIDDLIGYLVAYQIVSRE